MAQPSPKRRKTSRSPSSDGEDETTFYSFDESEGEEGTRQTNGPSAELEDEFHEFEEDGEDDDESEGSDAIEKDAGSGTGGAVAGRIRTKEKDGIRDRQTGPSKAQAGASTYASGTFKSNMFKLQVDELLDQIRPKHGKREADAESAVHLLKQSIDQMPSRGPFLIDEAERLLLKHKVAIPFPEPRPPPDAKYKFKYTKPASVNIVGSFALKTAARNPSAMDVDMILVMPSSLFDEKDYLDYRYFYKRAYYLACVASDLKDVYHMKYSIRFKSFHDNPLKPVLVVSPKQNDENIASSFSNWRINIIPCVGQDQFAASKLRPESSCVRKSGNVNGVANGREPEPSPFYNATLRSEMLMTEYLKVLHGAKKSCAAFVDACLLGSTWLRQRGFESSISGGGYGPFEWSLLMAICLRVGISGGRPLLSEAYSSYQLFKATLQLLAVKDLMKRPLHLGSSQDEEQIIPHGTPMIWDALRSHNLLFKMSSWSYKSLQHEARVTIDTLGDQINDGFESTFIMRVSEKPYRYDHAVRFPTSILKSSGLATTFDLFSQLSKLHMTLKEGLGDRVRQINIISPALWAWDLGSSPPKNSKLDYVTVGLVVNPNTVKRTVDQGPSAENKDEAAAFRTFWGEKAELRRFKDGSILESVVWTAVPNGPSVLEQVIRYLLHRQLNIASTEEVEFLGGSVDKLIKGGSDLAPFSGIMSRYAQFESDIRNLQDLPLAIRQIRPADSQLRYSAVVAPSPAKIVDCSKAADVTIQFEGTSRWPDDLVAIQRTKIAFLLKLSELLATSVSGITARVGIENEQHDVLNQAYLDVTYDSDATFRVRIHHDREQTLLERQLKDKSASPKTKEVAAIGLAKNKRNYVKTPAHTQALTRLCVRHPTLSGAIRLTKRWFASHLLSNHVAEEVIELLVARTFTQPSPWQTPSSVQVGFLRTLLWISRWDWRVEPLIVDLSDNSELKQTEVQAITIRFEAWRKLDPALNRVCLFAASSVDHEGSTWTDGAPAKVVAGRMSALAKAACAEISEKDLHLDVASLFSSPLDDFDFVLHLSAKATGRSSEKKAQTFKNLDLAHVTNHEAIGYEPVKEYLHELETLYGSVVVFFSGGEDRAIIAGLWSPQTARRAWKVNLAYSTIPIKSAGEEHGDAVVNKTAMLAEMARLGGDLVERVELFEH